MASKPTMILIWRRKLLTICQHVFGLFLAAIALTTHSQALSAQQISSETERFAALQAAYVFNIAKFFKWPDDTVSQDFVLCLFGNSALPLLQQLQKGTENRTLHQLPVKVYHLNADELGSTNVACQILYLAQAPDSQQLQLLALHFGNGVLKIAAPDVGGDDLALIELALEQNRLVLYLNAAALARSELKASPSFLSVAKQR